MTTTQATGGNMKVGRVVGRHLLDSAVRERKESVHTPCDGNALEPRQASVPSSRSTQSAAEPGIRTGWPAGITECSHAVDWGRVPSTLSSFRPQLAGSCNRVWLMATDLL